ncbi:hypothetical protein [Pseudomarimonas arenosa]|uniref:Uncharacterized protein n=1 Tax=Pseudomarimonas arenosa TaxID=2774145 RepID=A0AAW3ZQ92_9GAMM|nr:hypothetical protein [Pseudomarimonas arenosa]MBD8527903.1 hypothetical protein [Pseudomarimonas arenosa]
MNSVRKKGAPPMAAEHSFTFERTARRRRFQACVTLAAGRDCLRIENQIEGWLRRFEYGLTWWPASQDLRRQATDLADALNMPRHYANALSRQGTDRIERWSWRLFGYEVDYLLDPALLAGRFELWHRFSLRGALAQVEERSTDAGQWFVGRRGNLAVLCGRLGAFTSTSIGNMKGISRTDWVMPIAPLVQALERW